MDVEISLQADLVEALGAASVEGALASSAAMVRRLKERMTGVEARFEALQGKCTLPTRGTYILCQSFTCVPSAALPMPIAHVGSRPAET